MQPEGDIDLSSVVSRDEQQISALLDGQVVLLSVKNGEYYCMNDIGSRIWALLERPTAVRSLVERLVGEYEVEPDVCLGEVMIFLNQLQAGRLIKFEH